MADTIRARSALLALLADNTTGDISPQDIRDTVVSIHGVYGKLYTADASASLSVSTTPIKMTLWAANGLSAGTTPDHTNDQITVGTAGVYHVVAQFSFSGAANAAFHLHLRNNTVEVPEIGTQRKLGAGGDIGSCSFTGLTSCSANDVLTVYVEADGASKTFTLGDGQLVVHRIA
jgi:hypothetical protein